MMYLKGEGIERNEREAARWLGLAAEQGHAISQKNLALLNSKGQGADSAKIRQDISRTDCSEYPRHFCLVPEF
jgi:TPR repeat protein